MREVLSVRNRGVESLIAGFPIENANDCDGLRRWTRRMIADAGAWEVDRATQGKLNRLARGRGG